MSFLKSKSKGKAKTSLDDEKAEMEAPTSGAPVTPPPDEDDQNAMLGSSNRLAVNKVVSISADSASENEDDEPVPPAPMPPSQPEDDEGNDAPPTPPAAPEEDKEVPLAPAAPVAPAAPDAAKEDTPPAPVPPEAPAPADDIEMDDPPPNKVNIPPGISQAIAGTGQTHIPIEAIPQNSPLSPSESPVTLHPYDVHSQVMEQTAAQRRRKSTVAEDCGCPIWIFCIAFFFLLPLEPVTYPLNLVWVHVFPSLIEKDDLFDTHLDYFKLLIQALIGFVLYPLQTPVFKGGCCKNKDTIKKYGVAYLIFVLLACIMLVLWVIVAFVLAIVAVILAIVLYLVLALLVALFAVLCFAAAAAHSICAKVWNDVVIKILPFFDHPIVMDIDNDLVIREVEYHPPNRLFSILGLFGAVLFFPFTLVSAVLFGLQKTTKHILRISFVKIAFPIFVSTAMWVTGLIFGFMYYNASEEYNFRELPSVEEVQTSQIFGISAIILFFALIISSLCIYRKNCIGAQVTRFPTYILLIPGWIMLGPIMVLAVPFWGDRCLSMSWFLWNMIWYTPQRKMSSIDFSADRVRSYSKTLKAKNKKKKSKTNVLSTEDISNKRRAMMMVSWVVLGIPTFLVYPIAFICEPLPNFPYNRIIVPFCNSLLFWICGGISAYLWTHSFINLLLYIFLAITCVSLLVLMICCADPANFRYISSARNKKDSKANSCLLFVWVFCANLLSFPASLFGLVWPAWPMTVMQNYNVDAEIATKKAQESEEVLTSPRFWDAPPSKTSDCGRVMACVFCILAIPVFVVWVVSYGGYNIMRYEGHYYAITYLCSLLICASWIDYYFEFFFPDISFVVCVVNGLFALMLSYFFCNVKESGIKIMFQFVQNFLTILYFCLIFTLGLYGASISFLTFVYHGLRSFCGFEEVSGAPEMDEKRASRRSYVE